MASASPQSAPECPVCSGSGWKTVEIPGKARRVTRCDCYLSERIARLLRAANIPARYEHCRLADFDTDFPGAHRTLAAARLAAGRFVEEYPLEKTGLLLIGPIGTGKTQQADGIMQEIISAKDEPSR